MQTYSLSQTAEVEGLTRQGVYKAIKDGRLKACKINNKWFIDESDLIQYRKERYTKVHSKFNGEPLYQPEIGLIGVHHVCEMLGLKRQQVYYLVRCHRLSTIQRGKTLIFFKDNVMAYLNEHPQAASS